MFQNASVNLDSLSCSFTFISFLTKWHNLKVYIANEDLFPNEALCAKNGVYDPIIWNIYLHCKSDLYVFLPLIPQKKILYDE